MIRRQGASVGGSVLWVMSLQRCTVMATELPPAYDRLLVHNYAYGYVAAGERLVVGLEYREHTCLCVAPFASPVAMAAPASAVVITFNDTATFFVRAFPLRPHCSSNCTAPAMQVAHVSPSHRLLFSLLNRASWALPARWSSLVRARGVASRRQFALEWRASRVGAARSAGTTPTCGPALPALDEDAPCRM